MSYSTEVKVAVGVGVAGLGLFYLYRQYQRVEIPIEHGEDTIHDSEPEPCLIARATESAPVQRIDAGSGDGQISHDKEKHSTQGRTEISNSGADHNNKDRGSKENVDLHEGGDNLSNLVTTTIEKPTDPKQVSGQKDLNIEFQQKKTKSGDSLISSQQSLETDTAPLSPRREFSSLEPSSSLSFFDDEPAPDIIASMSYDTEEDPPTCSFVSSTHPSTLSRHHEDHVSTAQTSNTSRQQEVPEFSDQPSTSRQQEVPVSSDQPSTPSRQQEVPVLYAQLSAVKQQEVPVSSATGVTHSGQVPVSTGLHSHDKITDYSFPHLISRREEEVQEERQMAEELQQPCLNTFQNVHSSSPSVMQHGKHSYTFTVPEVGKNNEQKVTNIDNPSQSDLPIEPGKAEDMTYPNLQSSTSGYGSLSSLSENPSASGGSELSSPESKPVSSSQSMPQPDAVPYVSDSKDEIETISDLEEEPDIYDAVILHAEDDRSDALTFISIMRTEFPNLNLNLAIFEEFNIGKTIFSGSNLFQTCRYLFVFVTHKFQTAYVEKYLNEMYLIDTLTVQERNSRLIPVLKDECYIQELAPIIPLKYNRFLEAKSKNKKDSGFERGFRRLIEIGRDKYLKCDK